MPSPVKSCIAMLRYRGSPPPIPRQVLLRRGGTRAKPRKEAQHRGPGGEDVIWVLTTWLSGERDPQLLRGGKVLFYFVVVFELCSGDIVAAINTLPSTKIGLKIALRVSCF